MKRLQAIEFVHNYKPPYSSTEKMADILIIANYTPQPKDQVMSSYEQLSFVCEPACTWLDYTEVVRKYTVKVAGAHEYY